MRRLKRRDSDMLNEVLWLHVPLLRKSVGVWSVYGNPRSAGRIMFMVLVGTYFQIFLTA